MLNNLKYNNFTDHKYQYVLLYIILGFDCDVAWRALVQCTDIIVESTIDPFALARKLHSELIISENVYRRVKDKVNKDSIEDRLDIILDDIKDQVKYDASILTKFVNVLREKINRNDIADKIMLKLS